MFNKFFDYSLNIHFFKKINIPKRLTIEFCFLNNLKFLILNTLYNQKLYFLIPFDFKIFFFNSYLFFSFIENKNFFYFFSNYKKFFFFNFFNKILDLQTLIAKTIFIKGVGLRINFLDDSVNTLKLKLGYSHFIYLKYSQDLFIFLFKKKIIIRSYNNILLGNFCILLQNFRPINIFTGKGLYIKRSKFKLKSYIKKI